MGLRKSTVVLAATLAVGGAYWGGCGDDDDGDGGAVFFGDVSSVSGGSASIREPQSSFASRIFSVRDAWAQSTCDAPSSGNLLFCVESVCTIVEGDCEFSESVGIDNGPIEATLHFVDDENGDGDADSGEDDSVVTQNLRFCDGDQVLIDNAVINFTTGTTTASVSKVADGCPGGGTGTRTPTPPGGVTPTRTRTPGGGATATPGTPTPTRTPTTYAAGAAMNEPPGMTFVFLASLGVVGLLTPRRRRRP